MVYCHYRRVTYCCYTIDDSSPVDRQYRLLTFVCIGTSLLRYYESFFWTIRKSSTWNSFDL